MSSPGSADAQPSSLPVLWCIAAAALFGASTPAAKPLLETTGPVLLSGILYLGAAAAVAPWALRARDRPRPDRPNVLRLAGAVVFGGIVGPILLLSGLALAPAGSVALWLNLETVATAALAWVFFSEHLGWRTWAAVALIVAASVALSPGAGGGAAAIGLVAAACVAWGLDNNFTAVIDRFTPAQVTFTKGLVAGTVNVALGLSLSEVRPGLAIAGAGLAIGAASYGLSLLLYIAGAQQLGATRSQLVFSTAPAWGLALSWLTLGEPVQGVQLAAAAAMGLAIWLWHHEAHSHAHVHPELTHRHWHRHDDGHHDHEHDAPVSPGTWHSHEHTHGRLEHAHAHRPDLHHRHAH